MVMNKVFTIIFNPSFALIGKMMNVAVMEIGDNVLISPDLTGQINWLEGTVIEEENNTFNG
jgi:hypothetical protein